MRLVSASFAAMRRKNGRPLSGTAVTLIKQPGIHQEMDRRRRQISERDRRCKQEPDRDHVSTASGTGVKIR